jgi:peptide/nickel transport system ATP-binding protein
VEQGAAEEVLYSPMHPYTRGLLDSVPANNEGSARLHQIPGMTPSLAHLPEGCSFRERCPRADGVCLAMPEMKIASGHASRCHHPLC